MKRKQKRKHLEKNFSPPSAKKSKDLEKITPVLGPSEPTQDHGHTIQDSASENIFNTFPSDEVANTELQEFKEVVPEPPAVTPSWTQETGGNSFVSENVNCVSSDTTLIPTNENEVKTPQEVVPEPQMVAFVWTQPAGENLSNSEYLTCVSCTRKLIPIGEHGFQILQQIAPAPCSMNWNQVAGENLTSGECPKYASSSSKNISTDNHSKGYDFQKWKKIATEKYELETSRTQATGKNLSDSEYFTSLSTTRKLLSTEEHDFQTFKEVPIEPYVIEADRTPVAGENTENFSSLSTTRQLLPTEEHGLNGREADRPAKLPLFEGEYLCQNPERLLPWTHELRYHTDFKNREESSFEPYILEAVSTQAEGKNSLDSEYYSFLSTTSTLHLTNELDFQKWNDIATEPYVMEAANTQAVGKNSCESEYLNCSSTASKPLPAEGHDFQKWKQVAIKRYMLETAKNLAAGDHSSDSEYFTCFSTFSKLIPTGEHDSQRFKEVVITPHILEAPGHNSSDSEYFTCLSTSKKLLPTEEHDFPKCEDIATEPHMLEVARTPAAEDYSYDSKNFTGFSTTNKLILTDEHGFQKCQEVTSAPRRVTWTQTAGEYSSSSQYFTCVSSPTKHISTDEHGLQTFQEIATESYMLNPVRGPAAEDNSTSSEYFTCVSYDDKLVLFDKQETSELRSCVPYPETRDMPLIHKLEESECSSPFAYDQFPIYTANNPYTPPKYVKRERVMKVYYMHVRMKRGVAALEDTDEGQPSRKKSKMQTIAFPESIQTEEKLSDVSTKDLLTESDLSVDDIAQEAPEDDDIPIDFPPLETSSRARTPEWLVAYDRGYRCMGCCRVFPSLEILQDHVQNGVKEGFSCHSFHLALDWLRNKKKNGKKKCTKRRKIKSKRAGKKAKQYRETISPCI